MKNSTDVVNQPQHYQSPKTMRNGDRLEALDVIKAFGLGFNLGNAIKYLCRADSKGNKVQDLKKAAYYINDHIADIEAGREPGDNQTSKREKVVVTSALQGTSNVTDILKRAKKLDGREEKLRAQREYQKKWRAKRAKQAKQAKKKAKKA